MFDKKLYMKKWWEDNPDKSLQYNREYRKKHKEYVSKKRKEYYQNNIERNKENTYRWRKNNPERIKEIKHKSYLKNKKYYNENNKKWKENNPDKAKEIQRRYNETNKGKLTHQRAKTKRRAKEKEIINTLTSQEWIEILEHFNYRCAYCGCEFDEDNLPDKDHIIPISKGGNNIKENIVPACRSCNLKKGNRTLGELLCL